MSIAFANPFLLFGLAAGVIPILIHRLTHQKTLRRPFSAVRLLLHSQNVVARPQRLKHLLLLALRVAAVIVLVLTAARPTMVHPGLLAFGPDGAKVIIIDNSVSMGYRDEKGERFELAKKAAREIVRRLSGAVAIISTVATTDGAAAGGRATPVRPDQATKEIDSLALTAGRGDPASALDRAYRCLQTMKGAREIVLIGDTARGDWLGFDRAKMDVVPPDVRVTLLRIGGALRDSNIAIKAARGGSSPIFAGSPFPLDVTVSNLSGRESPVVLQILIDGAKVDQRALRLKPGEEAAVSFELTCNLSGWRSGEVRLSGDSGLAADDVFYFPLQVREKTRIAVVDGDPRVTMREGESYYLARALQPDDSDQSPFQVHVMHEGEFREKDLSAYDALFLLNVREPLPAKVAAFLGTGKSVSIFLGDRVLPENYNAIPLFPWRVRELRETTGKPEKIGSIDYDRLGLPRFREAGGKAFSDAVFSRHYRVEGGTKPLISLENGDPLLLEAPFGKGKLFLYTSSADTDWNDLPLKAAYVPILQGLVRSTLGAADNAIPPGLVVGEPFGEKVSSEQVTGRPGGAGIYRFSLSGGEVRRGVNTPFDESDLTKIGKPDLDRLFPGMGATMKEYREDGGETLYGGRRDLWPYLLGFVLLILATEMGVAHKI